MAHGTLLWPHTGAILCGGQSSRMGQPKHDLKLPNGCTMIESIVETMGAVCQSLVVLGPDDILPDLPHVHDLREGQGPLAGLEALLASGLDEQYLVVPCDVPRLGSTLLRKLTSAPPSGIVAFLAEGEERPQPLPLRIDSTCMDQVGMLLEKGQKAVHQLFKQVKLTTVDLSTKEASELLNVNTPQDFRSIEGYES